MEVSRVRELFIAMVAIGVGMLVAFYFLLPVPVSIEELWQNLPLRTFFLLCALGVSYLIGSFLNRMIPN